MRDIIRLFVRGCEFEAGFSITTSLALEELINMEYGQEKATYFHNNTYFSADGTGHLLVSSEEIISVLEKS